MEMSCWFYKEILCFGANLAQGPAEHDKIILQMRVSSNIEIVPSTCRLSNDDGWFLGPYGSQEVTFTCQLYRFLVINYSLCPDKVEVLAFLACMLSTSTLHVRIPDLLQFGAVTLDLIVVFKYIAPANNI